MSIRAIFGVLAIALCLQSLPNGSAYRKPHITPEYDLDVVKLIEKSGYPAERHSVTTDDGYVLELQRIANPGGCPVLLQHGFSTSSAQWVLGRSDRALAYLLADCGYDVWLGNSRGNTYGRRHLSLDPAEGAFWEFSWDEMGKYDIPAVVDYVLEATGQEQLSYVCHSLGCGSLFIGAVERPPLNGLVDVAVALAPSVSWANLNEAFLDIEPLLEELRDATRALGISAYLSDDRRSRETASTLCRRQFGARAPQCCSVPFQFLEALNTNLDQSLVPLIQRLYPAGVSYRTVQQFYQNFRAGQTFQAYDYGTKENRRVYGTSRPKTYDLSDVTIPVHIFYSETDAVINSKDVEWLATQLGNVQSLDVVPEFSHVDFLWAANADEVLYDDVLSLLPDPSSCQSNAFNFYKH